MTQIGVVKKVSDDYAVVSVVRKGACGDNCSMCGACNTEPIEVNARCNITVSAGDLVEISSADNVILFAMFSLFISPILFPILAFVIFFDLFGVVAGWLASGIMLLMSVAFVYFLSRNSAFLSKVKPTVKSVVRR